MKYYYWWILIALLFVGVMALWQYQDHQVDKCRAAGGVYLSREGVCVQGVNPQ